MACSSSRSTRLCLHFSPMLKAIVPPGQVCRFQKGAGRRQPTRCFDPQCPKPPRTQRFAARSMCRLRSHGRTGTCSRVVSFLRLRTPRRSFAPQKVLTGALRRAPLPASSVRSWSTIASRQSRINRFARCGSENRTRVLLKTTTCLQSHVANLRDNRFSTE